MTWTISELLPVAADQTKRQGFLDTHFPSPPPAGFEGDYTGQPSETGFTVVTVTTAAAMVSEITSTTLNEKKVIELQWNGVSSTGARPYGPAQSTLTANSSIDWGFDRPGSEIIVRPAATYSPILTSTYTGNVFYFTGVSKINFKNCVFDATGVRFSRTSGFYPAIAMVALENCTFQNITTATWAVELNDARVCHMDGCKFTNTRKDVTGSPNFLRNWNAEIKGHNDGDIHGMRGYTKGYMSAWWANIWLAGIVNYDTGTANLASGDHGDFLQTETPSETGQHLGYSILVECNIAHNNRPATGGEWQGIFGSSGTGFAGDFLVHNNIIAGAATWQCQLSDPTDNQNKVVTKNMFLRSATPIAYDVAPTVRGVKQVAGSGSLRFEDNYYGAIQTGGASNVTSTGNVVVDPRASAASPNRYVDILTAAGGFGTDANGWLTYTSPDAGAADAATAKAAFIAFVKPKAGWNIDAGPLDPALWPSGDWSAVAGGSGGGGGGTPPIWTPTSATINVQVN